LVRDEEASKQNFSSLSCYTSLTVSEFFILQV
jgi:hypothetical protein